MNKTEFLTQLRARLDGRMGKEEINNALSYYEEYFADAGPEREQEVIEELGTPETVANQVFGEQAARYVPPQSGRRSRAGVIALCVGLGVVLIGIAFFFILSFAGYQSFTRPPQVHVSSEVEPAEPSVSAVPIHREDGEKGYTEVSNLNAFTKVTVEVDIGQIVLEEGDGYALSMDWFLNSADMKYDEEDGVLKIWSAIAGKNDQRGGSIRITVPTGTVLEKVDFQTELGEIEVRDCAVSKRLKAVTGLGGVAVSGSLTGEIDLESGIGDISVELAGHVADYELDLETDVGSVYIQGEKLSSHYSTSDSTNSLECQTGMGDIDFRSEGK